MPKLRKVVLTRKEVLDCPRAFGAEERPQRGGSSHRRFDCWVGGVKKHVTVDESIDEFHADGHSVLWYIVTKQLGVSWETFYAPDKDVARRAGIPHRPPPTGKPA